MDHAVQFLVRHGDVVLFAWILAEQASLPIPTIPLLLAAGSLASTGRMSLAWSLVLALVACLMADGFWYQMGRWHGAKVLRLLCRISLAPDAWIDRIEAAFRRHEARGLLLAKFVPGLHFAAPPLAGTSGVSPLRFLLFDGLASLLWAGGYLLVGYTLSEQCPRVDAYALPTIVLVLVAATAAFIGFTLLRKQRSPFSPGIGEGSRPVPSRAGAQPARTTGA
jgi:membrane protein DedA with SNARE-associated domain